MASKVPIEVKMIAWFARAPEAEVRQQFAMIRALMADRGLLRRGAEAGKSAGKRARETGAVVDSSRVTQPL